MQLARSPHGYLFVDPAPSPDELAAYYRDHYYGTSSKSRSFAARYTDAEVLHKRLPGREIARLVPVPGSVCEIGVGEGFVLAELAAAGWSISGVDFTDDGVRAFNGDLAPNITIGDVFSYIDNLESTFDLVVANNILEHVVDPVYLLRRLRSIVKPGGTLRIAVPNDNSAIQQLAIEQGFARDQFWIHLPDHLSYFSAESLSSLLHAEGWSITHMLADFPIDFFLLNPDSNYEADPSKGPNCHGARVQIELAIAERSLDGLIAFREGCAAAGIGRDLVVYATPS